MKICITGCLGFIGTHVTSSCLKEGWEVCGIDSMTYSANVSKLNEFYNYSKFSFIKSDINDITWLNNYDYVINLAAETHVCNSIINNNNFINSNINGVHNLLEIIRNSSRFPVFFHFSTDEVYGETTKGFCAESSILCPSSPYSASKAAADMLVLSWNRTYKIPYIIIRPTNNYGLNQHVEKLIPKVCKQLSTNQKIQLHDNGIPIRNWLHVEDTASAVVFLIKSEIKNQIYNVSGKTSLSNYKLIQQIINLYNNNAKTDKYIEKHTHFRPGQDMRYGISSEKLQKLGWKPLKKLKTELPFIVSHYLNAESRNQSTNQSNSLLLLNECL